MLLENARLTDRVVEQEKVLRDLALAAEVQKRCCRGRGWRRRWRRSRD